ncbi:MAG TPA: hypothetical protein VG105_15795 [Paraburkholderia sp.]|jgi:hypothetical protein|nr:hypothetical protein [Paraburkholderia sp.]
MPARIDHKRNDLVDLWMVRLDLCPFVTSAAGIARAGKEVLAADPHPGNPPGCPPISPGRPHFDTATYTFKIIFASFHFASCEV